MQKVRKTTFFDRKSLKIPRKKRFLKRLITLKDTDTAKDDQQVWGLYLESVGATREVRGEVVYSSSTLNLHCYVSVLLDPAVHGMGAPQGERN